MHRKLIVHKSLVKIRLPLFGDYVLFVDDFISNFVVSVVQHEGLLEWGDGVELIYGLSNKRLSLQTFKRNHFLRRPQ